MKKKVRNDTLGKTQIDIGDWSRDGYWLLAINNSIAEPDLLACHGISTYVGGYQACRQCIVYVPVTMKTVTIDISCYRYTSCSNIITYNPYYKIAPYIVMATGSTGQDWSLVGGAVSTSILPDDDKLSIHPTHIMNLVGETTDTYTKFGDSIYPKSVSFTVTTNQCRMTI
jgi:hypothetical protein